MPDIRGTIDILNEVYLLSPKRQRFFELILSNFAPENRVHKLKGLCKTWWTERHECLELFLSLYQYIVTCMDAVTF